VHNANSTACSHFQLLLLQYVHIIAFRLFLVNQKSTTAKVVLFVTHQTRTCTAPCWDPIEPDPVRPMSVSDI
jgi:hypothetical protein